MYGKILSLHKDYYLTLVSIVQGTAYGYFVFFVATEYKVLDITSWILSLSTFILIALTWNEYVMGVACFEWIPSLIDSFIPFAFGITEFMLIGNINNHRFWYLSMFFFGIVTIIAFLNMYISSSKEEKNHEMLDNIGNLKIISIMLTLVSSLIVFEFFLIEPYWQFRAIASNYV